MTETELLSKQCFKEIFFLNSLYKKLIAFVETEKACRRAGYKTYIVKYWNNPYVQAKTYIMSNADFIDITDNYENIIRVDFIRQLQSEGLYNIEIDFKGMSYMNFLKRFYKDKKISSNNMCDLREIFFPLLTSQFYVPQSQELPFHPLTLLSHIKNEISIVNIPGFIDVKKYGDKYYINKFDMDGLDNMKQLIDTIITGEFFKDYEKCKIYR